MVRVRGLIFSRYPTANSISIKLKRKDDKNCRYISFIFIDFWGYFGNKAKNTRLIL